MTDRTMRSRAVGRFAVCAGVAWASLIAGPPAVEAALAPGDIAIIAFQSSDPDTIAFVSLAPIAAGEVIRFTDSGWQASGSFRANEGGVQFTVPSAIPAGTVVTRAAPFTSGDWTLNNAGLGAGGFQLALAGDQVLAFQGAAGAPGFVHALNSDSTGWSDAISSNTTALPAGLSDGLTAINLGGAEQPNAFYSGPTTGTKAQLLAAIGNPANWTQSGSAQTLPPWSFTVLGAGGPAVTLVSLPGSAFTYLDTVAVTVELASAPAPGVPATIDIESPAFGAAQITIEDPATSGSVDVQLVNAGTFTVEASAFSGATGGGVSGPFTVTAPPLPPTVFAGPSRAVVMSGGTLAVPMSGATITDVNGYSGMSYAWTPVSGTGIAGWTARTGPVAGVGDAAVAEVTVNATGSYQFTLTATDGDNLVGTAIVDILVVDAPPANQFDPPAGYYLPAMPGGVWLSGSALKSSLRTIISSNLPPAPSYDDAKYSLALYDQDPSNQSSVLLMYNGGSPGGTVSGYWDGGATWNREHLFPQSRNGGGVIDADVHHLRACNPSINSSRGNKSYNTVTDANYYFPTNGWKGDAARALMYCSTRYSNLNLVSGPGGNLQMGDIGFLLDSHYADPVSEFERRRNHLIYGYSGPYTTYAPGGTPVVHQIAAQGNRNPYIDHPELVWSVFGTGPNASTLYVGSAPAGNGSSLVSIDWRVAEGAPLQSAPVSLTKVGATPTTFDATWTGDISLNGGGPRQAFTSAQPQSRLLTVGMLSTAAVGAFAGSVTVDNTDVAPSAGAGQGSADADDTIAVTATVLAHSNGSWSDVSDIDSGLVAVGLDSDSGVQPLPVGIHNYGAGPLRAALDVDGVSGLVAPFALAGPLPVGIGAGGATLPLSFDTTGLVPGLYAADLTVSISDEDVPGATSGQIDLRLEITVQAPPSCIGDANGDQQVNFADITSVLANWGAGPGAGDANHNGTIDFADITSVLANWGVPCS